MVRTNRARSLAGLALLFAVTLLLLALVRRAEGTVLAFVSSPVSSLPSPPVALVILGSAWWARARR